MQKCHGMTEASSYFDLSSSTGLPTTRKLVQIIVWVEIAAAGVSKCSSAPEFQMWMHHGMPTHAVHPREHV